MDRQNAVSWALVGMAVVGLLIYSVVDDHLDAKPHASHPSSPPPITPTSQAATRSPLAADLAFVLDADSRSREATYRFTATNFSDKAINIIAVGRSGPGLKLVVANADPMQVPTQGRTTISVRFKVDECDRITKNSWPFPVTCTTAGKSTTQYLVLGSTSPRTEWQESIAEAICHPQRPAL
jgi:hypothetical protein